MNQVSEIESLDPLTRYEVMKDLQGPLLALWSAMASMDWSKVSRAMDELDRRAGIALLDAGREE